MTDHLDLSDHTLIQKALCTYREECGRRYAAIAGLPGFANDPILLLNYYTLCLEQAKADAALGNPKGYGALIPLFERDIERIRPAADEADAALEHRADELAHAAFEEAAYG